MCLHLLYVTNEPQAEHTALPARKVCAGWHFLSS